MRRAWILAIAAILGVAAFMASLALASRQAFVERTSIEQRAAQSYAVRKETLLLLSDLQDAETGQRGYLLVNQPAYLAPYQSGRAGALTRLDRLEELTRDSPALQRQIAELRAVVAAKLSELATTVDLTQSGDRVGAMAIVTSGRSKALMEQARTLLGYIRASEERLIAARAREAAAAAKRDRYLDYGLQVLGLLTLLGAAGLTFLMLRRAGQAHVDEAIAASEERLRHALDAGRMVAWDVDFATGKTRASGNAVGILGRAIDDRDGFVALIHPEDRARVKALREAAVRDAAEYNVEFRILDDGRELWMASRAQIERNADGRASRMVGITSDITALKAAELAANVAGARFRTAIDAVSGILWTNNAAGEMEGEQPGWAGLTGQTFDEYQGFGWSAAVHPDDAQPTIDAWNAAVAERRPMVFEHRVKRHDGAWRFCTIRAVPTLNDEGAVVEWVGVHTDITEQRAGEVRNQFFLHFADRLSGLSDPREITKAAAEMVGLHLGVNRAGYSEVNVDQETATFEAGYAAGVAPLTGTYSAFGAGSIADVKRGVTVVYADATTDPRTSDADLAAIGIRAAVGVPLIREGRLRAVFYANHREVREWTPGEVSLVEEVAARTWDALERARAEAELRELNATLEMKITARTSELVSANRKLQAEIRRREETQAALIQSQKLEALGQLTAGIAHDFNNILAAIAGGMALIERRIEDPKVKYITGHCKDAAFRGAKLVKQMLAFARQEVLAPTSVKLARLTDEIAPLIKQAIPGNIVSIDFPADLPPVLIDPVLLETALLNLAVNARDAMPGGGTLSLTADVSRPGDRNHPAELKSVEAVAITVRDSGQGMPPEIVQRVTEPFFTTKPPGEGTGLGLAMVYGFIGQSGGAMQIDSRVGEGTTITLYLPVDTATERAEPVATVIADTLAPNGVGAVLLVDDDAAVRVIAAEQLRDLGYTVTEADGYAAAMTWIEAGVPFDCVVSDVVMPGDDGVALAAAIRSTRPGLPILFMTGRADGKRVAGEQVLHKPIKLVELANAVAEVIDLPQRERATFRRSVQTGTPPNAHGFAGSAPSSTTSTIPSDSTRR